MARAKQAEMDFFFVLPYAASSSSFIDLGQCYSLVNRLFARQGMQYAVAGMAIEGDSSSVVTIKRLPEHWPCINAWEKAYHLWRESQDQVLDLEPGIQGRYRDFKIFMNSAHQAAGVAGNLLPDTYAVSFGASEAYDWDASTIQIPNDPGTGQTAEYNLHMIGASTPTSKGLITGYAASRARPQQVDPNVVDSATSEDWYRQAFDVGEDLEEIREDIEDDNDSPPYVLGAPGSAVAYYPGGANQGSAPQREGVMVTRASTALAKDYLPGFTSPCGLLQVVVSGDEGQQLLLRVTLMPGEYKGCMARVMQEVN